MKFGSPFAVGHILTRGFRFASSIYYLGIHLAGDYIAKSGPTQGGKLVAMERGQVYSAWDISGQRGWLAKLITANGWVIGYAHMQEKSPLPDGTWVNKGDVIGFADSTGNVTGPHVHIDLWNTAVKSPEAVAKMGYFAHDPEYWIGREQGGAPTPPPQEDWFDMATVEDLKTALRAVLSESETNLVHLVNIFEDGSPQRWAQWDTLLRDTATKVNAIDAQLDTIEGSLRNVGFGLTGLEIHALSVGMARLVKSASPGSDEGVMRDAFKKALT